MRLGSGTSSQSVFSRVPTPRIGRSAFDRSHSHKTDFDSGFLIPVLCDEVLPGDTMSVSTSLFARLATPLKPFMDSLYADIHFFFVPNRILWANWERFNGAQDDPSDPTDFLTPQLESDDGTGFQLHGLADYFGIPIEVPGLDVNAFHHMAYRRIYNEWYRDENVNNSQPAPTGDGPFSAATYDTLLLRNKRHDYFTSCLPWPQKGDPVSLPLQDAPVLAVTTGFPVNSGTLRNQATGALFGASNILTGSSGQLTNDPATIAGYYDPNGTLYADLATIAPTINMLREAITLQQLLELDARGGTRYIEILRAHFGVISPDSRLQRPEYLGGGTSVVGIKPVAQSSATDAGTPQGNLAATGTVTSIGPGFHRSFTEHGVILGILSVRADLSYQQGLNRMWSRRTRYDYFWPTFAHLGEQGVLNKELYAQGPSVLDPPVTGTPVDDQIFGYQERYAEYRYKPSIITGNMRSISAQSLDVWHLAQDFGSLPTLNYEFIQESPPVDRVIAVPGESQFVADMFFKVNHVRPIPVRSNPGLRRL